MAINIKSRVVITPTNRPPSIPELINSIMFKKNYFFELFKINVPANKAGLFKSSRNENTTDDLGLACSESAS